MLTFGNNKSALRGDGLRHFVDQCCSEACTDAFIPEQADEDQFAECTEGTTVELFNFVFVCVNKMIEKYTNDSP